MPEIRDEKGRFRKGNIVRHRDGCLCFRCNKRWEPPIEEKIRRKEYARKMGMMNRGKISKKYNKGKGWEHRGYKERIFDKKQMSEQDFIWCSQAENLKYIPRGFIVHHLDLNKSNNNPSNLILLDRSSHYKLHWAIKKAQRGKCA